MRVSIMAGHRNSPPPKVISTPRWWPSLARSSGSGPANSNTRSSKFISAQTTAAHEYSGAVFTAQPPAVASVTRSHPALSSQPSGHPRKEKDHARPSCPEADLADSKQFREAGSKSILAEHDAGDL